VTWKPDYATLAQERDYRQIGDVVDDDQLSLAITAASRAIDRAANRQFGVVASVEVRYYTASWSRTRCSWTVPIDDLSSTTDLEVDFDLAEDLTFSTALTSGDWRLHPLNALAEGEPWTHIEIRHDASAQPPTSIGAVRVTGLWGWASVPDDIVQACLLQVSRIFERRQSPFGVAGSPADGSELRLLERLDPDVAVLVRNRRRMWGAR
jgi:hypothetical protein